MSKGPRGSATQGLRDQHKTRAPATMGPTMAYTETPAADAVWFAQQRSRACSWSSGPSPVGEVGLDERPGRSCSSSANLAVRVAAERGSPPAPPARGQRLSLARADMGGQDNLLLTAWSRPLHGWRTTGASDGVPQ